MKESIISFKGENMKVQIIRKSRKKKKEKIIIQDFEFEIIYTKTLKRARKIIKKSPEDFTISYDFEQLFSQNQSLMSFFPKETLEKISARHGVDLYEMPIGVYVENLSKKNIEILTKIALIVRFMNIYSPIPQSEFDFLGLEAGLTPFVKNSTCVTEKIAVFLNDKFLIKEAKSGKTYYDIKLKCHDEFYEKGIYEINGVFVKCLEENSNMVKDVKIRELMSK